MLPWPWLSPSLMTLQYVMYFGFVDDIMFSHNGPDTDTGHWRIIHHDLPCGARCEICYH